jgi:transposase
MLCEIDGEHVVQRATDDFVKDFERTLGPNSVQAHVAIEACREAWHVHDQLVAWAHEVTIVDTTRVKQLGIGQHGRKNDRIDAEVLARAVASGGIPKAHVLSPARRELRMQLSVRRALVETRANYMTTIRGLIRAKGHSMGSCNPDGFAAADHAAKLSEDVLVLCTPLVDLITALTPMLARVESTIEHLLEREPIANLLMSAPGVGVTVAAMFISIIDDAKRFKKAHQLESHLGLVPLEDTTGGGKQIVRKNAPPNPASDPLLLLEFANGNSPDSMRTNSRTNESSSTPRPKGQPITGFR